MKILFAVTIFLTFSITSKATTNNSAPKVPKEIINEVCESMEYNDFQNILVILKEEGFKLENVLGQIYCKASVPNILFFVLDMPSKYGLTTYKALAYFDHIQKTNSQFDYSRQVLNIPYKLYSGSTDTLLSRSLRVLSMGLYNEYNPNNFTGVESTSKLIGIINGFIKRGAQTAKQLGTTEKLDLLPSTNTPFIQKRYKNIPFTAPCKDHFSSADKPEQYPRNKRDAYHLFDNIEWNAVNAVKNALSWCGIDINRKYNGDTPLTLAVLKGHIDIVKLLLSRTEIQVNKPIKYKDYTALDIAYLYNKKSIIPLLLKKQAKCTQFCEIVDSEKYYQLGALVE